MSMLISQLDSHVQWPVHEIYAQKLAGFDLDLHHQEDWGTFHASAMPRLQGPWEIELLVAVQRGAG